VGSFGAWVGTVRSVFIDLGNGLAGTGGLVPHLAAEGTLLPSDSLDVKLADGLPFGTAHVVFSFSAINAPFKGGVLVPNPSPSALILALVLDAGGGFAVSSSWPPNVPAGIELYLQVWVQDAGGPVGFAASNAVHQVTP
jgi:hypothetical protein